MIDIDAGVAIIGAGFGGSVCALIAQRCGLRPVLLERGSHPRFALGESSTPVANLVLEQLADEYDLPRLKPLCEYGPWLRAYREVQRGLKRGFSYFQHRRGERLVPSDDHSNELLVAANPDAERGDTHWLRSDFDHFLVREAQAAGVPYVDRVELSDVEPRSPWRLRGTRDGERVQVAADFVIDASGDGGALARALGIANDLSDIRTNSRAVYSHFRDVRLWHDVYADLGGKAADHPFPCDAAALHHVFEGGWMWVLRFDNGVTSAGFSLDCDWFPLDQSRSPEDEWAALMRRFPSIQAQFESAVATMPMRRTGRLQRRLTRAVGPDWAMLPTAAGFVDALHSTGNAHTLTGIERLMRILRETRPGDERTARLQAYERAVLAEVAMIDRVVHGCYLGFARFEWMAAYAMLYFAAATFSEHRRRSQPRSEGDGFLLSHDPAFREILARAHEVVLDDTHHICEFAGWLKQAIAHYNVAGLCDDAKRNLYPFVP